MYPTVHSWIDFFDGILDDMKPAFRLSGMNNIEKEFISNDKTLIFIVTDDKNSDETPIEHKITIHVDEIGKITRNNVKSDGTIEIEEYSFDLSAKKSYVGKIFKSIIVSFRQSFLDSQVERLKLAKKHA